MPLSRYPLAVLLTAAVLLDTLHDGVRADPVPPPLAAARSSATRDWLVLGTFPPDIVTSGTAGALNPALQPPLSLPADTAAPNAWNGCEPLQWSQLQTAEESGRLELDRFYGPARRTDGSRPVPRAALLWRDFIVDQPTSLVLQIHAPGPTAVWLDARPLAPLTPNTSSRILVLPLDAGKRQVVVRTDAPATADPWTIQARVATVSELRNAKVRWPAWRLEDDTPWTEPGRRRRVIWGDPEIHELLGRPELPFSLEVSAAGAREPMVRIDARVGAPVEIVLPESTPAGFLQLNARITSEQLAAWQGVLDPAGALTSRTFVIAPDTSRLAHAVLEQADARGDRARPGADPQRRDYDAIVSLLDQCPALFAEPDVPRLRILTETARCLAAKRSLSKPGDTPLGWLRLTTAPPENGRPGIPYTLALPTNRTADTALPLALVLPPRRTDEFYAPVHARAALDALRREGWAVACVAPAPSLSHLGTPLRNLDAVRRDVAGRLGAEPPRMVAVAFDDAAPAILAATLDHAHEFSAIALIDPVWQGWENALANFGRPGPGGDETPLFILETPARHLETERTAAAAAPDGRTVERAEVSLPRGAAAGGRLAHFVRQHVRPPQKPASPGSQLVLRGLAPDRPVADWVRVRESADPGLPYRLNVDVESSASLRLEPHNAACIQLRLEAGPNLAAGRLLTIALAAQSHSPAQDIRIIGPSRPKAIELRLRDAGEETAHWVAVEIDPDAFLSQSEDSTAATAATEIPAWPAASNSAGLADLLARAIRAQSNAAIAVVPADATLCSQPKGGILFSETHAWAPDLPITTTTMPARRVVEALVRDYAGPRRWASAGFDAVFGPAGEDVPWEKLVEEFDKALATPAPATPAESADDDTTPSRRLRRAVLETGETSPVLAIVPAPLPGADAPTSPPAAPPTPTPSPTPTPQLPAEAPPAPPDGEILLSAAIKADSALIVVATWPGVLAAFLEGPVPETAVAVHDDDTSAPLSTWQALEDYIKTSPELRPPAPDRRPLPRKTAPPAKSREN